MADPVFNFSAQAGSTNVALNALNTALQEIDGEERKGVLSDSELSDIKRLIKAIPKKKAADKMDVAMRVLQLRTELLSLSNLSPRELEYLKDKPGFSKPITTAKLEILATAVRDNPPDAKDYPQLQRMLTLAAETAKRLDALAKALPPPKKVPVTRV